MAKQPAQRRGKRTRREGFALFIALIALTILAVLVADLHETTGTSFAAAMAERDQLRAEYMAKSGINLTRMLIAQERILRMTVATPIYQLMLKRPAPQLPVWRFANMVLKPFANFEGSKEDASSAGFDLDLSQGLGKTNATFEILATAENGKINVNDDPQLADRDAAKTQVAGQLYSLIGGTQPSPNKYDVLFSSLDEKGRQNTRVDLVGNVVDWWDFDEQKSSFDPTLNAVQSSGGEDVDYYQSQPEPYSIKNAPFDTLEEVRLVRGMSDDVWATFVEPDLEDPSMRLVTIYGGKNNAVNPNEADPLVMLARICALPPIRQSQQLLCNDMIERTKFISLLTMIKAIIPIPLFSRRKDFVDFVTGSQEGKLGELIKGLGSGGLSGLLGGGGSTSGQTGGGGGGGANANSGWPFAPIVLPPNMPDLRKQLDSMFTTTSRYITVEATGHSGHAQRRIRTVINIDPDWTPPKPNAGKMAPLGIYAYYRID